MKHLKCQPSIFGKDKPFIVIPRELLAGAESVVLARQRYGFQPFSLRLPHQIYVDELPQLLDGASELWALPVGVAARWVQVAGPTPGVTHPSTQDSQSATHPPDAS